jgi:hypothetical protein
VIDGLSIVDVFDDPAFFGPHFRGDTWGSWRVALKVMFGEPLEPTERETFTKYTARATPPTAPAKESYFVVGRRGGKSRVASVVAVFLAAFKRYDSILAPGEVGIVSIIAPTREQAGVVFRFVEGLVDHTPALRAMVVGRTASSIEFSNRTAIEVHTASYRSIRGRTLIAAVFDELAFWSTEDGSANPDTEIRTAVMPAMMGVPGAALVGISSPHAKRGLLWEMHKRHFAADGDPIVVWQAPTAAMRPDVDQQTIDEAYEKDAAAASAEYGALFRQDIQAFIDPAVVDAAVALGRLELPYCRDFRYAGFVDPSGGASDSFTLAVAHAEKRGGQEVVVVDCVRERPAPFSPEAVAEEFVEVLRAYRLTTVVGDRYSSELVRELFRKRGVTYRYSEKSKSEIYLDALTLLNSHRVELPEHKRLIAQLCALERRTARGGRETVDHPPNQKDDIANAAAGVLTLVSLRSTKGKAGFGWQPERVNGDGLREDPLTGVMIGPGERIVDRTSFAYQVLIERRSPAGYEVIARPIPSGGGIMDLLREH